jgi:hypothetical protein
MTPDLRLPSGVSPLTAGTADDTSLPPPIPFDQEQARLLAQGTTVLDGIVSDPFSVPTGTPAWLGAVTGLIRPICVGALMAIPTVGAATIGAVAMVSGEAADRMAKASVAFLGGIPDGVLILIGTLAGGYTAAKTAERLVGRPR